jgi:riboflavin kinase/FMN adenylyltransferase
MKKRVWLQGTVIHGDGRGRTLGFPTANILLEERKKAPADGIYACWAKLFGEVWPAVLHVGPRPTFIGTTSTVELYLLDFPDRDLYGEIIAFCCVTWIREIEKFNSSEELIAAINQDCERARKVLKTDAHPH